MKKLTVLLSGLLVLGLVSLSWAQQQAAAPRAAQTKTFTGSVSQVTPGDPTKKTQTEIVAVGADKKEVTFLLGQNATLTGADGKPITLDKLTVGSMVEITYYTSRSGVNTARSIKLLH